MTIPSTQWRAIARDLIYVVSGILCCGFALKGFFDTQPFFDGGMTGIALLIDEIYGFNIAYVIVLANLPRNANMGSIGMQQSDLESKHR